MTTTTTATPLRRAYAQMLPARRKRPETEILAEYASLYRAELVTARQVTVRDFVVAIRDTIDAACDTHHAQDIIAKQIPSYQRDRLATLLPSRLPDNDTVNVTFSTMPRPNGAPNGQLEVTVRDPSNQHTKFACAMPVNNTIIHMPVVRHADPDFPAHLITQRIHEITSKLPATQTINILTTIHLGIPPTYYRLRSTQLILKYATTTPTHLLESILIHNIAAKLKWHTYIFGAVLRPPTTPSDLPYYLSGLTPYLAQLSRELEQLADTPHHRTVITALHDHPDHIDAIIAALTQIKAAATSKYAKFLSGTAQERAMLAKAAGL